MVRFCLSSTLLSLALGFSACAADFDDDVPEMVEGALTTDECSAAAVGNKVVICHATGSSSNPFVRIEVAVSACKAAHADHINDVLPALDGSCPTGGCADPYALQCSRTMCSPGYTHTADCQCVPCGHGGGGNDGGGGGGCLCGDLTPQCCGLLGLEETLHE